MESLLKPCQNCHKPMNGGVYRAAHVCPHCRFEHEGRKANSRKVSQKPLMGVAATKAVPSSLPSSAIVLSSKPVGDHVILESFDEISSECTLSIKLTPDLFKNGKFIGKNDKVTAAVKQGQKQALAQLRQLAHSKGANMVAGVAVKNKVKALDGQNASITVTVVGKAVLAEVAETAEAE